MYQRENIMKIPYRSSSSFSSRAQAPPGRSPLIFRIAMAVVLLTLAGGCRKETMPPQVNTFDPWQVGSETAMCGGEVTDDRGFAVTARGLCWSTEGVPDITHSRVIAGAGIGSFTAIMAPLDPNTRYFIRAWATTKAGTGYGNTMVIHTGIFRDIEGNTYATVRIGNQLWMAENLATATLSDGTPIKRGTEQSPVSLVPGWYHYKDDSAKYHNIYGRLYNWYAVETGLLCPEGWRVPFNTDWEWLDDILGGSYESGGKLKERDTLHWHSPNLGASDLYGFGARPGGLFVAEHKTYADIRSGGNYWNSDGYVSGNAWSQNFSNTSAANQRHFHLRQRALSVRCVR